VLRGRRARLSFAFCLRVEHPLAETKISKMALHRDIYWVGRQWAVTGYGMQAVDQKQKSKFDIEIARLWDDDLSDSLRAEPWFNPDDFSKGLSLARARYPEPPRKAAPERKAPPAPVPPREAAPPIARGVESVAQVKASAPVAVEPPPKPVAPKFHLRIENSPAKFVRPWRIRIKR
jgi:hypothetical protein